VSDVPSEGPPTPALFDHAKRVYEEMLARSTKQFVGVPGGHTASDDDLEDVYEGHLTRLFSDLGIANPYYSKIRDALVAQGCIEQLRRGGGSALSKWIICKEPDEETFRNAIEMKRAPKGATKVLEQQVKGLKTMLNDAIDTMERQEIRLQVLEGKLEAMRR
jgi:hypothetical protein